MKIKKFFAIVINLVLMCLIGVACKADKINEHGETASGNTSTVDENEESKIMPAKSFSSFENDNDVIICWGDSLTEGMSMKTGYNYPHQLQGNLNGQYKVLNAGVPGETSNAISSRANVIDVVLTNDVVFEEGMNSVDMDREFLSTAQGEVITYKGFGQHLRLNKILIGGELFDIYFKKGDTWDNGTYRLVRKNTDTKQILKKGTATKFDYSEQYKNVYCNVILMGANDKGVTTEELIERYRTLGNSSDKSIYIIPYFTESNVAEMFKEAFGDKAIDIRDYFVNNAHKDYDLEVTKLDQWAIKTGVVPSTFRLKNSKTDVHLNEIGYKVMADQVYKKGVELGYWK